MRGLEYVFIARKYLRIVHDLGLGTRSHQDYLAQMLAKEVFLPVCETVKHLSCALVITDVSNLVSISQLLNLEDEGR